MTRQRPENVVMIGVSEKSGCLPWSLSKPKGREHPILSATAAGIEQVFAKIKRFSATGCERSQRREIR